MCVLCWYFCGLSAYQAFVGEIVPIEQIAPAYRLNAIQFNVSRAIGPAVAGFVLAQWGPSMAFLVNAIGYLPLASVLLLIRPHPLPRAQTRGVLADLAEQAKARLAEIPGLVEPFSSNEEGNQELHIELDRELLEMRIFPAINIPKSGTRKDDLLYHPDELKRINMIRRQLAARPGGEAMELLIRNIKATSSNTELLLGGLRD